jgi:hypothetical protein
MPYSIDFFLDERRPLTKAERKLIDEIIEMLKGFSQRN